MKTNFATPVSMVCTKQEAESILPELEKLGYVRNGLKIEDCCWTKWEDKGLICTNDMNSGIEKYCLYNPNSGSKTNYGRHYIDHYNPELFLALAAMREGNGFYLGEIAISLDHSNSVKENELAAI